MSSAKELLANRQRKVGVNEALAVIKAAMQEDKAVLERLASILPKDELMKHWTKINLNPFPANPETIVFSVWDNEFGCKTSTVEARYAVQVQGYKVGNNKLKSPDFDANADLLKPSAIRKRAKRWGIDATEKALFEEVVAGAEENGLLVGRFLRVVRGKGSHTFAGHYVIGCPDQMVFVLYTPDFKTNITKLTDSTSKGDPFATNKKPNGKVSKVIGQARISDNASLNDWANQ